MQNPEQKPLGKVKQFLRSYGKLGAGVYLGVSVVSLTGCFVSIRLGVDAKKLLQKVGIESYEHAGTLIAAYALHKTLLPLRLGLTAFLTKGIAKRWPYLANKGH